MRGPFCIWCCSVALRSIPQCPYLMCRVGAFSSGRGLLQCTAGVTGELRSHSRTTESILRFPPPPRSSFSVFLHNYLKVITEINGVLSLPRALPKPRIITARTQYLSSPLVQDFINTQQHAQHAAHLYPFDLLPSGPLVHHKIGSVCSCFMKPWRWASGCVLTWDQQHFRMRFNDWERRVWIIHPEAQFAKKTNKKKRLPVWFLGNKPNSPDGSLCCRAVNYKLNQSQEQCVTFREYAQLVREYVRKPKCVFIVQRVRCIVFTLL